MKSVLVFLVCVLSLCAKSSLLETLSKDGVPAKITLFVHDQDENPIPDADVRFSFGFSSGKQPQIIHTVTDANGTASAQAKTNLRIAIQILKEGFYSADCHYSVWQGNSGYETGRWEPWNPTVDICLYSIINPNKTNYKVLVFDDLAPNQKYGIDLLQGTLVSDLSSKNDVDFVIELEGVFYSKTSNYHGPWDRKTVFRFLTAGDGIIEMKRNKSSDFKYTYSAPLEGYQQKILYESWRKNSHRDTLKDFPSTTDDYLIFHITRKTIEGEDLHYYGIIDTWNVGKNWMSGNVGITIRYRLNPTPGDRNIEYFQ